MLKIHNVSSKNEQDINKADEKQQKKHNDCRWPVIICWFPFNFGMKEIRNEYLMSVVLSLAIVPDIQFLQFSPLACLNILRNSRRKFWIKHFFVSGDRELWLCLQLELTDADGSKLWQLGGKLERTNLYWDGYDLRSIQ